MTNSEDRIKLFKLSFIKLVDDQDFIAHALNVYANDKKISLDDVRNKIKCDEETFYLLGLCKYPKGDSDLFFEKLVEICGYIGIPSLTLYNILLHVNSLNS